MGQLDGIDFKNMAKRLADGRVTVEHLRSKKFLVTSKIYDGVGEALEGQELKKGVLLPVLEMEIEEIKENLEEQLANLQAQAADQIFGITLLKDTMEGLLPEEETKDES